MCTDCNCGNKRAIPRGAVGRRWAQPGRKQKPTVWGEKIWPAWEKTQDWGVGKEESSREINLRPSLQRVKPFLGNSGSDPELMWIRFQATLQGLQIRGHQTLSPQHDDPDLSGAQSGWEWWTVTSRWGSRYGYTGRNKKKPRTKSAPVAFVFISLKGVGTF